MTTRPSAISSLLLGLLGPLAPATHAGDLVLKERLAAHPFSDIAPALAAHAKPAFADTDGDGLTDFVLGRLDGTVQVFRNVGAAGAPVFAAPVPLRAGGAPIALTSTAAPTFGDIDDDGDDDLVVGAEFGDPVLYENVGAGPGMIFAAGVPLLPDAFGPNDKDLTPALVDLDGDGDDDIVVGAATGAFAMSLRFFERTGGAFEERLGAANPLAGLTAAFPAPAFADLDDDGDVDCLLGSAGGIVRLVRNDGGTFVVDTSPVSAVSRVQFGPLASPSVPPDALLGRRAVVVGNQAGVLRLFRRVGPCRPFAADAGAAPPSGPGAPVADDLPLPDAAIEGLAWWGSYDGASPPADVFTITYRADAGGLPGAVLAGPFTGGGGLVVQRAPVFEGTADGAPIFLYTADHPSLVPAPGGGRVWVEIVNAAGAPWRWQHALPGGSGADGTFLREDDVVGGADLAVCLDVPTCAADLDRGGSVGFADLGALLAAWADGPGPADLTRDGAIGVADLALLLGAWGPCRD